MHRHAADLGDDLPGLSLDALGLARKPVVSVPASMVALRAFASMATAGVSAAGVTSAADGPLVANLSTSDLRGLTPSTWGMLALSVSEFLLQKNGEAATVTELREAGGVLVGRVSESGCTDPQEEATIAAMVPLHFVRPSTTFGELLSKFDALSVHHLWVLDENHHPVGVVTPTDVLKVRIHTLVLYRALLTLRPRCAPPRFCSSSCTLDRALWHRRVSKHAAARQPELSVRVCCCQPFALHRPHPTSMSKQELAASVDWPAVARAEAHDLVGELQRQLNLPPLQKNEAMRRVAADAAERAGMRLLTWRSSRRFLEVNRGMLLAAKAHVEDAERDERCADAKAWREATRRAARERSSRAQHAARGHAADSRGADSTGAGGTWERVLALAESLHRPSAGPRKSSVSRAFATTMMKASEAEKGHGGAPA